jgi:hypothetical protein
MIDSGMKNAREMDIEPEQHKLLDAACDVSVCGREVRVMLIAGKWGSSDGHNSRSG